MGGLIFRHPETKVLNNASLLELEHTEEEQLQQNMSDKKSKVKTRYKM